MSLSDKISLWDRKAVEDCLVHSSTEVFEGVPDDEAILEDVDIRGYQTLIYSSIAYDWLLSRLKLDLYFGDPGQDSMTKIRACILAKLPTGRISRTRAPQDHQVTFELSMRPVGLMEDKGGSNDQAELINPDAIVLTGFPNYMQATSVSQYISQTWPSGEGSLLSMFQRLATTRFADDFSGSYSFFSTTNVGCANDAFKSLCPIRPKLERSYAKQIYKS